MAIISLSGQRFVFCFFKKMTCTEKVNKSLKAVRKAILRISRGSLNQAAFVGDFLSGVLNQTLDVVVFRAGGKMTDQFRKSRPLS